jgi:hypothetical protein
MSVSEETLAWNCNIRCWLFYFREWAALINSINKEVNVHGKYCEHQT